jgi:hypothetical protein
MEALATAPITKSSHTCGSSSAALAARTPAHAIDTTFTMRSRRRLSTASASAPP